MQGSQQYNDIIHHPHYSSMRHPHMSRRSRAAQFSAFAALSGYDTAVQEAGRRTVERPELTEDTLAVLDERMQILREQEGECPAVTVTCFVPDLRKAGGACETVCGCVRRIDDYEQKLVFTDGRRLALRDILALEGELFRNFWKTGEM